MRMARTLFMMIVAALLPTANLAAQASSAPQQATSPSEKSAGQQKDDVRNDKDQPGTKEAGENQKASADMTRTTTKRRPSTSQSGAVITRQAHLRKMPAMSNSQTNAPAGVTSPVQTQSNAPTNIPNKAVSHRPSAPASPVPANGLQFRNTRDPGARLASSGGPLTVARGTAAINGTNMKRKP